MNSFQITIEGSIEFTWDIGNWSRERFRFPVYVNPHKPKLNVSSIEPTNFEKREEEYDYFIPRNRKELLALLSKKWLKFSEYREMVALGNVGRRTEHEGIKYIEVQECINHLTAVVDDAPRVFYARGVTYLLFTYYRPDKHPIVVIQEDTTSAATYVFINDAITVENIWIEVMKESIYKQREKFKLFKRIMHNSKDQWAKELNDIFYGINEERLPYALQEKLWANLEGEHMDKQPSLEILAEGFNSEYDFLKESAVWLGRRFDGIRDTGFNNDSMKVRRAAFQAEIAQDVDTRWIYIHGKYRQEKTKLHDHMALTMLKRDYWGEIDIDVKHWLSEDENISIAIPASVRLIKYDLSFEEAYDLIAEHENNQILVKVFVDKYLNGYHFLSEDQKTIYDQLYQEYYGRAVNVPRFYEDIMSKREEYSPRGYYATGVAIVEEEETKVSCVACTQALFVDEDYKFGCADCVSIYCESCFDFVRTSDSPCLGSLTTRRHPLNPPN
jgi:hypothetical protein